MITTDINYAAWEKAAEKYPWIKIDPADGVPEIYADNHMLSSLRTCEAYFEEGILNQVKTKGRAWSLEFGQWFHRCMEWFDSYEKASWKNTPDVVAWIAQCKEAWETEFKLDELSTTKQYQKLKGWQGAQYLLLQYWTIYGDGKERFRTVGTELGFGKNKEVPIQESPTEYNPFRAFLTGRIDRLVDNGTSIGPLDRKTTSYFDGTEGSDYKPHDGMQGYVFAAQRIVDAVTGGEARRLGRLCNAVIIDHVSLTPTKNDYERFKRSVKFYTPLEMQRYVERMQRTFHRLYEIVIEGRRPDWATDKCSMMWFRNCPYKQLHELPEEQRSSLMGNFYTIGEQWSPYDK